MSRSNPKLLILDMLECIGKLNQYTLGMDFESFVADSKTKDAVLRNIQVLGEAASQVSKELQVKHPEVEWTKIIRSRNIVTHEYSNIDYDIIWKILKVYILPLQESLHKIYQELES